MKTNSSVMIRGSRVVLVPYEAHHVSHYHEWMASEELQRLTASEPLSLQEEYDMQQSWRNDPDSTDRVSMLYGRHLETECTFIVLARSAVDSQLEESQCMAGDVNLFFNDPQDPHTAELDIMIPETKYKRGGLGREAVLLMMMYGISELKVSKFMVKIGYANAPSLSLFQSLGFKEMSRSDVFEEVTLELEVDEIQSAKFRQVKLNAECCEYQRK